jgi:hypothetical protein
LSSRPINAHVFKRLFYNDPYNMLNTHIWALCIDKCIHTSRYNGCHSTLPVSPVCTCGHSFPCFQSDLVLPEPNVNNPMPFHRCHRIFHRIVCKKVADLGVTDTFNFMFASHRKLIAGEGNYFSFVVLLCSLM